LEKNPFADKPPRYVRALYYDYTFASREERAEGLWWHRQFLTTYFPVVRLTSNNPSR
jgi:lipase maturation factor 1